MNSLKRFPFFNLLILLAVGCWGHTFAQTPQLQLKPIRPSQKASVMQTIGVTDITITYSRPPVKSRTIFAEPSAEMEARHPGEATLDNQNERKPGEPIVPYRHVWRAGANEATLFQVTDDVLINGQPLKAGSYSMHTIPGKDEWTIIFNSDPGQWGSFAYDAAKDALRVKTKAMAAGDNQEWLVYTFDPVTENSATVNLRWEKVRVPFTVEVKDVRAAWRKRADEMMAANPTAQQLPQQAAQTYFGLKNYDEALKLVEQSIKIKETSGNLALKSNILSEMGKKEEALKFVDQSIKVQETFGNLVLKSNLLWDLGKKEEAQTVAAAAIAKGKADKANTAAFEKRVADRTAAKTP